MRYTDTWLGMTPTEQLVCVSSLVDPGLVVVNIPGKISHVHFLAAMVVDYGREPSRHRSRHSTDHTRGMAPRAQEVVDTATKSKKRGGLQHVTEAARKWKQTHHQLEARPKPEAKPQPKARQAGDREETRSTAGKYWWQRLRPQLPTCQKRCLSCTRRRISTALSSSSTSMLRAAAAAGCGAA